MANSFFKIKGFYFPSLLAVLAIFIFSNPVVSFGDRAISPAEPSRRFFSDDIVLFGQGPDGKDFFLDLNFNRKEDVQLATFQHYRFASLIYNETNESLTESIPDPNFQEVPSGFLQKFENKIAADLSARESYSFTVNIAGTQIRAEIDGLQGDFIVKNSPEYTRYVSEGKAIVQLGSQTFSVHAIITKIYSSDYDKYIFPPGDKTLKSETQVLNLWDEAGNFYLIDQTRVKSYSPSYKSHTWVLFKNADQQYLRKAFDAEIIFKTLNNTAFSWDISLPTLNKEFFKLQVATAKTKNPEEGIAKGILNIANKEIKVGGLYFHHVYN